MSFDLGKLIEVLAENAPNEAVGLFIATYGVFIVAFALMLVLLIRFIKKTANKEQVSDAEIKQLKNALKIVTEQAATIAVDNAKVSDEIKNEIKANNDVTMQLMIAMAINSGMNYTDICNTIEKATSIYEASKEQYNALVDEANVKAEQEAQAQAEAQAQVEQLNNDLASIKIGV